MSRHGTFYLGRVIKGGSLTQGSLIRALSDPVAVVHRDYAWTFTDFQAGPGDQWFFARLTKYKPEGVVRVIDHDAHREVPQVAPDLIVAASPFVYVPDVSGLAYLHIWNQIQREVFARRFAEVVEASLKNFFVRCELEPIADIRSFVRKLKSLDSILDVSARVHLPNPLFGPLWKSLRDYVARRNAETLKIEEHAKSPDGLSTDLPRLVSTTTEVMISEESDVAIGDAAVLMASDGYGAARITGTRGNRKVILRTSETQVNFGHDSDAKPTDLAERVIEALRSNTATNRLRHDED